MMTQNNEFAEEIVATVVEPEVTEEIIEEVIEPEVTEEASEETVQVEEVEVEAVLSAPRKKRRFWPWLCVYAVVLLAAAFLALRQLHNYLQAYEAKQPNHTLTQFLNWIETENYNAMYASSGFEETVLNTKAEYLRYLERTYGQADGALSLRELENSSQNKQTYTVYAGETALAKVVLLKNPAWGETPFTVYTVCEPIEDVTIVTQADTRVSLNGTDLALLNLPAEEVQATEFKGLPEEVELPTVYRYTIKGLLNPPEITGLTLGGETCTVQSQDKLTYYVSNPVTDEEKEQQEQLATQVMNDYMEFTARRLTAQKFKKYLYKPSDLYKTISDFKEYIDPKPTSFACGQFDVRDYVSLTEQDFSCTVQFMQGMTQDKLATDNLVAYRLTFFKMKDEWKLFSVAKTETAQK